MTDNKDERLQLRMRHDTYKNHHAHCFLRVKSFPLTTTIVCNVNLFDICEKDCIKCSEQETFFFTCHAVQGKIAAVQMLTSEIDAIS